jgi:hypothetical protein
MAGTIKLGSTVQDKISGFTGVVVGRTEYLYGCIRLEVAGDKVIDNKIQDSYVFDEPQLTVLSGPDPDLVPTEPHGTVLRDGSRLADPNDASSYVNTKPRRTYGPRNLHTTDVSSSNRRADFVKSTRGNRH